MSGRFASSWRKISEGVAAALLAVIFVAFIVQIVFRYAFNWPVGWTAELSVIAWLWLVLWGASFVLTDQEEIRIDFLVDMFGRRGRIVLGIVSAISLVALFAMSLPAAYAYVSFMKVEKSSYLNIRFDLLFSIYIVFSAAVIGRNAWRLVGLLRGHDPDGGTSSQQPDPVP